jgi:predicted ATPase
VAIVGRDSELSDLSSVVEQVRSGCGTLVLVIGEAGIGKTALCEQASLIAAGADMAVVWAGCGQPAPTFWPWRQVLPELAAITGHPRGDAELLAVPHPDPLRPAETEGSAGSAYSSSSR